MTLSYSKIKKKLRHCSKSINFKFILYNTRSRVETLLRIQNVLQKLFIRIIKIVFPSTFKAKLSTSIRFRHTPYGIEIHTYPYTHCDRQRRTSSIIRLAYCYCAAAMSVRRRIARVGIYYIIVGTCESYSLLCIHTPHNTHKYSDIYLYTHSHAYTFRPIPWSRSSPLVKPGP